MNNPIRTFNKEKNKYKEFPKSLVTPSWSKITGYYPAKEEEPKEVILKTTKPPRNAN